MRKLFGLLSVTLIMVAFQNCSRVAFDSMESGLTKTGFASGPNVADVIVDGGDQVAGDHKDLVVGDKDRDDDKDLVVGDKDRDDDKDQAVSDNLTVEELELIACASDEGGTEKKVLICHYPPGNADERKTKCIGRSALKAHENHGGVADTLGACASGTVAGGK